MLFFIQLIHSVIAVFNFGCLFYMIWAHWVGKKGVVLNVCYWAIAIESAAVLLCRFTCPISILVARVWSPSTPSILFPDYLSNWYLEAGAALVVVAIAAKILRYKRSKSC